MENALHSLAKVVHVGIACPRFYKQKLTSGVLLLPLEWDATSY